MKVINKVLLICILVFLWSRPASAAFTHYTTCTIKTGQVPSSQSSFPVDIHGTGCHSSGATQFKSVANGGFSADPGQHGYDIRPYSGSCSGTALTYQLIYYNATTGILEMRALVTAVDGAVVYLCYGDSSLSSNGSNTTVWPSSYVAVWPFSDGTTLSFADVSQGGNTLLAGNNPTATSGLIDGAAHYANTSDYLAAPIGTIPSTAGTISIWVKPTWAQTDSNIHYVVILDNGGNQLFHILKYSDNSLYCGWYNNGIEGRVIIASGLYTLNQNAWNKFDLTWDSSGPATKIYLNNTQIGTTNTINATFSPIAVSLGIGGPGTSGGVSVADIDIIKVSNVARGTNWLTIEYNNEVNSDTFWTESADFPIGGGGSRVCIIGGGLICE